MLVHRCIAVMHEEKDLSHLLHERCSLPRLRERGVNVESLILAQDKRWRRALPMRVERVLPKPSSDGGGISGVRVRITWVTYPSVGDTSPKGGLRPHTRFAWG